MNRKSLLATAAGAFCGYAVVRAAATSPSRIPASAMGKRVVILGAGFGGMACATKLAALSRGRISITLVDRHNYHLFTPMLYQVASCSALPYDVAVPLRRFTAKHAIQFRRATVTGIEFDHRRITTDTGALRYDYLVIALGATTNYFGNESARQHSFAMKSLEDGIAIRNHVIDRLEEASRSGDPEERRALLTFVVIGGGATGVETAGAMADVVRHVIAEDYAGLRPQECRVIVVEAEDKLLGHMSGEMASIAERELKAAGVEIWLNAKAQTVTPDRVDLQDGRSVATRTVIWATGVRAPDLVAELATGHGHGGSLAVNACLQLAQHPNVFAIGDNAHVSAQKVPLLAAAAMQEGNAAATNIARLLQGRSLRTFRYKNLGSVVSVGHGAGVAEIGGRVMGGFAGWLAWRVVHLARITTFRNKIASALDWGIAYFHAVDTARLDVKTRRAA